MADNRRRFPYSGQVGIHFLKSYFVSKHKEMCFKAEGSDSGNEDDTYDAYEEDIAIATFYFKEPMVFEYTRHVKG